MSELTEFGAKFEAALATMAKQNEAAINSAVETAVKAAISAAAPTLAPIIDVGVDEIDQYVMGLLGQTVAPVTQPTDPASQIAQLQQHVAALTVATVGSAQIMGVLKTAAPKAVPAPAAAS